MEGGEAAAPQRIRGARRGGVFDRDLTQGSITKNLWALAGPAIAENLMNTLDTTVDLIWVGRLGAAPLAAVGVGGTLVRLISTARMGLATGTRAMVARFVGADDMPGANHVTTQAFVLSGAFAALMALIGIFLAEMMLRLLGLERDVITEGLRYVQIAFVSSAFMSFRMMTTSVMQASGDAVTPMKITAVVRITHIVIDPILIFGWLGLPRLEVTGAALANLFSQGIGSILGLYLLFIGYSRLKLTFKNFRVDFGIVWRIIKIGIPSTVTSVERSLSATVLIGIVATFGTYAVAAQSVVQRIQMLVMQLGWGGLAQAAAAIVGQNLGAGKPERAERSTWVAIGFYWLIMAVAGVIFLVTAEGLVRVFNSDPQLVKVASTWLRIGVVSFVFMPPAFLFSQVLGAGAGDTVPPMVVSILGTWVFELPLAILISKSMGVGVYGIAWAMAIATAARAAAMTIWFRRGKWKLKKV